MPDALTFAALKAKQRRLRANFPGAMSLRVHRSISWIQRAEAEVDDADARMLFLWIAFNAAYAEQANTSDAASVPVAERSMFASFFKKVVDLDQGQRIYDAIWKGYSGPIRTLLKNRYVFGPFWRHQNSLAGYPKWEADFARVSRRISYALGKQNTARILEFVFDRLYVLRNQLMHGGATWDSYVNREQVRDGAAILGFLVPVFIDIMMDNPQEDWGQPLYPVVD